MGEVIKLLAQLPQATTELIVVCAIAFITFIISFLFSCERIRKTAVNYHLPGIIDVVAGILNKEERHDASHDVR